MSAVTAVYLGNGMSNAVVQASAFEKWLGVPQGSLAILDYGGWDQVGNMGWPDWTAQPFIKAARHIILGTFGIPLPGQNWQDSVNDKPDAQGNTYTSVWTAAAKKIGNPAFLVDGVRLAHEMDGDWFRWGARGQGTAFQQAMIKVIRIVRANAPKVWIAINPTSDAAALMDYYFSGVIGLVDRVGINMYPYQHLVDGNSPQMNDLARQHVSAGRLAQADTITAWAKTHGKPVSFFEVQLREWNEGDGFAAGTGDDAIWWPSFYAWAARQGFGLGPGQVADVCPWEDPNGGGQGLFNHHLNLPNATASFLKYFSGTASVVTPPVTTPPVTPPPVVDHAQALATDIHAVLTKWGV
jgi:hypothetical protein